MIWRLRVTKETYLNISFKKWLDLIYIFFYEMGHFDPKLQIIVVKLNWGDGRPTCCTDSTVVGCKWLVATVENRGDPQHMNSLIWSKVLPCDSDTSCGHDHPIFFPMCAPTPIVSKFVTSNNTPYLNRCIFA